MSDSPFSRVLKTESLDLPVCWLHGDASSSSTTTDDDVCSSASMKWFHTLKVASSARKLEQDVGGAATEESISIELA